MRRAAVAWALVLATSMAAVACSAPEPTPTEVPPLEAGDQRIVYVTHGYEVFTAQRNGTGRSRLIGGQGAIAVSYGAQQDTPRYFWPTWSPSGKAVAVSRTPGTSDDASGALMVLDSSNPSGRAIHQSPPRVAPFIAQAAPHYVQWAPDGGSLSFVAVDDAGLRLFISPASGEGLETIASQAPLYHTWAPDSSFLIVHRLTELFRHDVDDGQVTDFGTSSLRYRVAAVNRDGSAVAYVAEDRPGGAKLVVSGADGSSERVLAPLGDGTAAFLWSPTEDVLALTEAPSASTIYEGLRLVSPGSEPRELTSERLGAFFWAPDGQQIALVTVQGGGQGLRWVVLDVASGESRVMTDFVPSRDSVTLLGFFDQYASSHSPWSDDSRYLIFAGAIASAGDQADEPQVYVIDTRTARVSAVADGLLAFWVPPGAG